MTPRQTQHPPLLPQATARGVVLERTDNNNSQEAQDSDNDEEREQRQRQDHDHNHTRTTPAYGNTNHC